MGSASSTPTVYDAPARGVSILLTVLTTPASGARIAARYLQDAAFGLNDFFAYIAFSVNLGQLICVFILIDVGAMSMPALMNLTPEDQAKLADTYLAGGILYTLSIAFVKFSLLFLMQRIFTLNNPGFRIIWWGVFVFIVMWTGAVFGLVGYQVEHTTLGSNIIGRIATPIMGGLNALTDVVILILPLWSIKKMKLPSRQKFAVATVFAIGLSANMVSVVRVIFMTIPAAKTWSTAYENYTDIILSVVETSACLICACVIVYRTLFFKVNEAAVNSCNELSRLLTSRGGEGSGVLIATGSARSYTEESNVVRARSAGDNINRTDQSDVENYREG